MSGPRIGSLFSGYGGLDIGVRAVLGGEVAWHCEIDEGASRILAHHHPDVPNLGDITAVDWSVVEPVDVLTGGFPCQDVSLAGLRRGMRPDTRSGLWSQMAYAIDQLRPSLVVIENVRGLLSADAHGSLEPCPWCVGDDEGVPLRALGGVLGDLAGLGFDAEWVGLRAADVGAPHGRFRVFIVAWPVADTDGDAVRAPAVPVAGRGGAAVAGHPGPHPAAHAAGGGRSGRPGQLGPGGWAEPAHGRVAAADAGERGRGALLPELRPGQPHPGRRAVPDPSGDGRHEGRPEPARLLRGPDAALSGHAATHPDRHGLTVVQRIKPGLGTRDDAHRRRTVDWGEYEPAIRRWERLTGRPAPSPHMTSSKGGLQLSPAFSEWLMHLPLGWVTDPAIWTGIRPATARNLQLKALGNGVVWSQAAEAVRVLLARRALGLTA